MIRTVSGGAIKVHRDDVPQRACALQYRYGDDRAIFEPIQRLLELTPLRVSRVSNRSRGHPRSRLASKLFFACNVGNPTLDASFNLRNLVTVQVWKRR